MTEQETDCTATIDLRSSSDNEMAKNEDAKPEEKDSDEENEEEGKRPFEISSLI
jgi:hypothetical protein